MAAGAAVAVVGWWTGYKLGGVAALVTAETLQQAGVINYWQSTFLILGAVVVLCNIALMAVPEQPPAARTQAVTGTSADSEQLRSYIVSIPFLVCPGVAGVWAHPQGFSAHRPKS